MESLQVCSFSDINVFKVNFRIKKKEKLWILNHLQIDSINNKSQKFCFFLVNLRCDTACQNIKLLTDFLIVMLLLDKPTILHKFLENENYKINTIALEICGNK